MIYANRLFVKVAESGDFPLTPMQCTYFIGGVSPIASAITIPILGYVGRRPIYIAGQFFMSVFMFLAGLSVMYEWNLMSLVMVLLFVMTF